MEMALAGALAERGALGHSLNQSYAGDMGLWAHGAGVQGNNQATVQAALGAPLSEVIEATKQWLDDAYPRIKDVANAFTGKSGSTIQVIDYDSGPWSLTYDEVVALASE